jgi:peptidyl-prolyl cis-trans isomerase-like protein 2
LTDPFEAYQEKINQRLNRQDQSEEAVQKRAAARAAREKDRTTWLGTDLGVKGAPKKPSAQEENPGVGKYLATAGSSAAAKRPPPPVEFGQEKKKKKGGGFGDFSGW